MPFIVASRRLTSVQLNKRYDDALLLDLTSRGPEPWVRFSPFYPHGGIPVPFSPGVSSMSVEGIWQGLKVFETTDIDPAKFTVTRMTGLKRKQRAHGKVLGHREGVQGTRLLSYAQARRAIYLPTYRWVLDNRMQDVLDDLRRLGTEQSVVLLDYEINSDVADLSRPLSHAGLVKRYLDGDWPE